MTTVHVWPELAPGSIHYAAVLHVCCIWQTIGITDCSQVSTDMSSFLAIVWRWWRLLSGQLCSNLVISPATGLTHPTNVLAGGTDAPFFCSRFGSIRLCTKHHGYTSILTVFPVVQIDGINIKFVNGFIS